MPEHELADLLGVDARVAADLLFATPSEASSRVRAAWDLIVGHFGDPAHAREWLVTPSVALADRAPIECWLTDGFALFEAIVEATVYGPPTGP
jgi:uncharacterized protein (DUF2384 family)